MVDGLIYKMAGNVYVGVDLSSGVETCVEYKIENNKFYILDMYEIKHDKV